MKTWERQLQKAQEALGFKHWTPGQLNAFKYWMEDIENEMVNTDRICIYYPTGTGKTPISLTMLYLRNETQAVVVAPPITHPKWIETGAKLGIKVLPMSHAKFRMKSTTFSRKVPIIVDEFHLLGGQRGQGWKKFDRLARSIQAPLIFCSATPNYNDAERVYCVAHVLDPIENKGGFISWLYTHCITEHNAFSTTPDVVGFRHYEDAEDMLANLPGVVYIPDEAPDILEDVLMHVELPQEFLSLNLDQGRGRIMASQMEKRHRERYLQIVDINERGHEHDHSLRQEVLEQMLDRIAMDDEPVLIFCAHSSIAEVVYDTLVHGGGVRLITGDTTPKKKDEIFQSFLKGEFNVLIGTATLATGADGIDKICDKMIILDDTDDDSLRRQLVGRILVRGVTGSNEGKVAYRFQYSS